MMNWLTLRGTKLSFHISSRTLTIIALLLFANFIVMTICTGLGSTMIHPIDVIKAIFGQSDATSSMIVLQLRLPLVYARHLNVQELGDEVATGVGSRVQSHRTMLLILSVALAGSAASIGGTIGFIGLMAPHIARKLVGPAYGGVIPASALIGSLVLMLADLLARIAFIPLDIPAGVFTAAIGAPFFIYLLFRHRRS